MIGRLGFVAAVAVVATGLAACSGVPTSSSPEIIGPAEGANTAAVRPSIGPQNGAEAREIVKGFLDANVHEPEDPRGAHSFLTPTEQSKWSDSTVTILQQGPDIHVAKGGPTRKIVTVTGIQIGRLLADGTYTPDPAASGGGGQPVSYDFGLRQVDDEWRINDLPDGLVVTASDFHDVYKERPLYFYDLAEQRLVPDLRYTALTSFQALASWQLRQLLNGPRQQLEPAVHSEVPGKQPLSARASVTVAAGPFVSIELPGSSQLDPVTKVQLAAQIAATFGQTQTGTILTITDGGKPVNIPKLSQRFTRDDVSVATGLFGSATLPLFYLDAKGRLVDSNGKLIDHSPIGTGGLYHLTSVAVAARNSADYEVAGTIGSGALQTLWIGTLKKGLRKSGLEPGPLTRPTWAPGLREAWVGDGTRLYLIGDNGKPIAVLTGLAAGRIKAVRFSAEGSRLAMIVTGPGNESQVWVGAVIRSGASVRIDSPQPITPPGYVLSDVAWNDDTTLYVIGHGPASDNTWVWQVQSDGSNLLPRASLGLPQVPDSITATRGAAAWVSAGGAVFEQGRSDWEGPNNYTISGTKPVYLE